MSNTPRFRNGLSAEQAHTALKSSVEIMDRAHYCAVLWFGEIMRRKLYRALGFSTMRAYALEALGFSATRAGDFIRLARKLEALPVVKKEMAAGRIGYTKAREIVSVADSSNEQVWVKEAKEKSRRELAATVKQARTVAKQVLKANPGQVEMMPSQAPPGGRPPAPAPTFRTSRCTFINVRIATDTPCRPRKVKKSSPQWRPKSSAVMLRSIPRARETPARFRRKPDANSWLGIGISVGARVALTRGICTSITSRRERMVAATIPKTWSHCVPLAMICGTNKVGICSR